jgi:hypothetical protein
VNAHLEWDLDRETPQETSRSFVCLTEPSPLEDWLAITNKAAERGLSRCVENLASQISTALQAPSDDAETNPEPSVGFGNYDPAAGEW